MRGAGGGGVGGRRYVMLAGKASEVLGDKRVYGVVLEFRRKG